MYNVKRKLCKVTPEIISDSKFYKNYEGFPNYKTQINHYVMIGTMSRVNYLRKLVTQHFTKAANIIRDLSISDDEAAKRVKRIMQSIKKITSQSKPKLYREFMQYMAMQLNYYDSKESFEKFSVLHKEFLEKESEIINPHESLKEWLEKESEIINPHGSLKELWDKVTEADSEFQKIFDLSHEKYGHLLYPYFNNNIYNIEEFVLSLRRGIKDKIFYIFDTNYGESYIPII